MARKCKECKSTLVDSFCFPESKTGWHYRYCVNTEIGKNGRTCSMAHGNKRQ